MPIHKMRDFTWVNKPKTKEDTAPNVIHSYHG